MCTQDSRQFPRHVTRAPKGRQLAGIFVLVAVRGAETLHGTAKAARTWPEHVPRIETQHAAEDGVSLLQVSKMLVGEKKQTQDEEPPEAGLLMRRRVPLADLIKSDESRVEQMDDLLFPEVSDQDQEPTELSTQLMASGSDKTLSELQSSEGSAQGEVEQLSESRVKPISDERLRVMPDLDGERTESLADLGAKSSPDLPVSEDSAQLSESRLQPIDDGPLPEVLKLDHDQPVSLADLGVKSSPELTASEATAQLSENPVQPIDDERLSETSDMGQAAAESMAVLGVKVSPELPGSEAGAESSVERKSEDISLAEQMPEGDMVGLLQTSVVVHRRAGRRGGHGGRNAAKSVKA